jgi:starch synthase (maltosyl-transferring)
VNAIKARLPVLNEEGPQQLLSAAGSSVVILFRETISRDGDALITVLNADPNSSHRVATGPLKAWIGGRRYTGIGDITPQVTPLDLNAYDELLLEPLEIRVFQIQSATVTQPCVSPSQQPSAAQRITIENISPRLPGGLAIKQVQGDVVEISADIFADGHDILAARLILTRD